MAPPLALGEVPEEVRMNKLLGMNAPPAAKVYNEKERYHVECCVEIKILRRVHPTHWLISTQVEWKDLHMTQEEQDRIAYLRERGAKHVFTCVEIKIYGAFVLNRRIDLCTRLTG